MSIRRGGPTYVKSPALEALSSDHECAASLFSYHGDHVFVPSLPFASVPLIHFLSWMRANVRKGKPDAAPQLSNVR